MAKTTLYTLTVQDNVPEIKPLNVVDTIRIFGKLYWLVPVEQVQDEPAPQPPPRPERIGKPEVLPDLANGGWETKRETVKRLAKEHPEWTATVIAKEAGVSVPSVSDWLHQAGMKTLSDRIREQIEGALLDAGALGLAAPELTAIAKNAGFNRGVGPILTQLQKAGTVKRLGNGNWAVRA
jgi:hypothetical protein